MSLGPVSAFNENKSLHLVSFFVSRHPLLVLVHLPFLSLSPLVSRRWSISFQTRRELWPATSWTSRSAPLPGLHMGQSPLPFVEWLKVFLPKVAWSGRHCPLNLCQKNEKPKALFILSLCDLGSVHTTERRQGDHKGPDVQDNYKFGFILLFFLFSSFKVNAPPAL